MKRVCIIFGGKSPTNEFSIKSAETILSNIDKQKYEILPIYIDKNGIWYKYIYKPNETKINLKYTQRITNIVEYLMQAKVIFPVLHGLYGEDGTIQGLFELLKIPYVGCKVLASSIGMDKVYTKIVFEKAGLKQAKYQYIRKEEEDYIYVNDELEEEKMPLEKIIEKIVEKIKFPMFVKPSNSVSSVGVTKAVNEKELEEAIKEAGKYDIKILIEQGIDGKEVECAVVQKGEVIASCVGQVLSAEEFYSYDAKYVNQESKTLIPANIREDQAKEIQNQAIKAFKAIDGKGISRVDFFIENVTGEIYINEINTMPGFTPISMYPKLFEASGISYKQLLDILIENA